MIQIRRAEIADIPAIMEFIDVHWKKGHILARDRELFEWQFVDDGRVNMILGIDDENGIIYGIEGIIPYNHTKNPDISGSIWKTVKCENTMLGIEMDAYLKQMINPRHICSAGLSKKAMKINELLGGKPTRMDHFYRLNDCENYEIARVLQKKIPEYSSSTYSLQAVPSIDEMMEVISEDKLMSYIMSKDYRYIKKRYFDHPIYSYDMWFIVDEDKMIDAVLVTREEVVGKAKCCKIVDCLGETSKMAGIGRALDELMVAKGYEFVEIYSFGVDKDIYRKAGMIECGLEHENIIPNYFHPFEQKNVELKMVEPEVLGLRLFLGDGDQDRPS